MSVISVKNLKYRYPMEKELALKDISFEIEAGEFIGIIGENGAGKSSLAQALMGLIPQFYKGAYGGCVLVDGQDASKTPVGVLCKSVGLIFQNPFNQLSGAKDNVFDEVSYGLQNLGFPKEEILKRTEELLKTLEIWDYRDRNPFDLSGGQLQRVAIASILAMEPKVLILDEPTSQLDPAGSEEVFRTVEKLKSKGITILMVEQKIEKLAEYCDRIMLLNKGRLIDLASPSDIFSREDIREYGIEPPLSVSMAISYDIRYDNGKLPLTIPELFSLCKNSMRVNIATSVLAKLRSYSSGLFDGDNGAAISSINSTQTVFKIRELCFSYQKDKPLLNGLNLNLDFRPTAIIGQNGAGKTTLVRLIKGLLRPDKGALLFHDSDISGKTVAELAGKVGYVFQNPDDQIFKSSVIDELMFGPLNIGMDRDSARKRALEALRQVELYGCEDKNPYDLDLADRKMLAIASVLAMDPEIIILDEPTIAQDLRGREILRRIIHEESEKGRLIIAILHDMDFVLHSFQRVLVMSHGDILADGNPIEVFRQKEILKKAALMPPYELSLLELLN